MSSFFALGLFLHCSVYNPAIAAIPNKPVIHNVLRPKILIDGLLISLVTTTLNRLLLAIERYVGGYVAHSGGSSGKKI